MLSDCGPSRSTLPRQATRPSVRLSMEDMRGPASPQDRRRRRLETPEIQAIRPTGQRRYGGVVVSAASSQVA